jgi:hypothetical protein
VKETTGVLPPEVEEGMVLESMMLARQEPEYLMEAPAAAAAPPPRKERRAFRGGVAGPPRSSVSSTPAQVRERKLGDLFEYEIEHPVTIRRNQSALVPIVLRPFEGRPVLLYNKQTRAENPMRCVEFKNTTGLTLEGGPVTVLEGGSYVGEAMMETSKPDEPRLIPYAVELAVYVLDNIDTHADRIHRVVIRKGLLKAYYVQVQQTTYTLNNKADGEQIVYLDHPRSGKEWKLFETPEPQEITENYWRFRFSLLAKKVTAFVVKQKHTLHQSFSLSDVGDQQLALWMEQKYLDKKTEQVLRQVIELRQEAADYEEKVKHLEKERAALHQEQKRIRENLASLGDRASEKELRERYVRNLNTQEDRLEAIEKEIREHGAARDRCRAKISALLEKLEYETTV